MRSRIKALTGRVASRWLRASVPTAATVILDDTGRALILKRGASAPWLPGLWNLPGGIIDPGESPKQAALRELREETNLTPRAIKAGPVITDQAGGFTLHVFFASGPTGSIRLTENSDYAWVELDDLGGYTFVPQVRKVLQGALS